MSWHNDKRVGRIERGYDKQWFKVRAMKLKSNPLCQRCESNGVVKPAVMVHHIKPISSHPQLRLVIDNLMSLCHDCHEVIEGRRYVGGCDERGYPIDSGHWWQRGIS